MFANAAFENKRKADAAGTGASDPMKKAELACSPGAAALQLARLHRRAELIKQSRRQPPAAVLLGAFSRPQMVDRDASGAPV